MKKRGFDISLLTDIIKKLAAGAVARRKTGSTNFPGIIRGVVSATLPDWLLIYEVDGDELILYLTRTGSPSDLF
ncbi:type II toxin-antitoxin system YafQ family toxin [Neglectibacter timonensis]|uniref:type II toxin-antitoxin system YafQ family toxin n=1 Tax=Neglectibacter timonensis TaxID=1776382 RepID=UPI0039A2A9A5